MLEMWDTCYDIANNSDGVIFSYNFGDRINSLVSSFYDTAHGSAYSSWAQLKEQHQEALEYYVSELNVDIEEFIADNQ